MQHIILHFYLIKSEISVYDYMKEGTTYNCIQVNLEFMYIDWLLLATLSMFWVHFGWPLHISLPTNWNQIPLGNVSVNQAIYGWVMDNVNKQDTHIVKLHSSFSLFHSPSSSSTIAINLQTAFSISYTIMHTNIYTIDILESRFTRPSLDRTRSFSKCFLCSISTFSRFDFILSFYNFFFTL